jgi:hypothetical protein
VCLNDCWLVGCSCGLLLHLVSLLSGKSSRLHNLELAPACTNTGLLCCVSGTACDQSLCVT